MIEHITDKKSTSSQRQPKTKNAGDARKETRFAGIHQYIIDKGQTPVQRKLDDGDIQKIMDLNIDTQLKSEFYRIYQENKDNMKYGDSKKGGDSYIEDGHLGARTVDDRWWFANNLGVMMG